MPLDQHIKCGHGESEACLKGRPDPVHDLFEMVHHGHMESTVSTSIRSSHLPR